jgi:uncharacterized protein YdeI (YjbR/CyaY-like superfamily)
VDIPPQDLDNGLAAPGQGVPMGKRIPEITAYIDKSQPFARPILRHLRDILHETCPELVEVIKWSHPNFDYKGPFAGMAAFKAHATFGFWKDELLRKGKVSLSKSNEQAMGSFGRLTSIDDLPSDRALKSLIKEAMRLNDEGVKRPTLQKARNPIVVKPPAYFMTALRKNKRALTTFEGFAPSHKRDYVEWVVEAKTDATRERRLRTAIEWMAEGKRRNWKYERC